jgi:hypothetical protein
MALYGNFLFDKSYSVYAGDLTIGNTDVLIIVYGLYNKRMFSMVFLNPYFFRVKAYK